MTAGTWGPPGLSPLSGPGVKEGIQLPPSWVFKGLWDMVDSLTCRLACLTHFTHFLSHKLTNNKCRFQLRFRESFRAAGGCHSPGEAVDFCEIYENVGLWGGGLNWEGPVMKML